jgi:hypothetical protein
MMSVTTQLHESVTYKAKNRAADDRSLWIEHPYRADYKLTSKEKPRERARDVYRFELKVAAGKTASLKVEETKELCETQSLLQHNRQSLAFLLKEGMASPKLREALQKGLDIQTKQTATQQELTQCQQQLQAIGQDQARLRANLKETPPAAAAYKRYLQKLDTQETEIEKLQERIKILQEASVQQCQQLEAYWNGLEVEATTITLPRGFGLPVRGWQAGAPAVSYGAVPAP